MSKAVLGSPSNLPINTNGEKISSRKSSLEKGSRNSPAISPELGSQKVAQNQTSRRSTFEEKSCLQKTLSILQKILDHAIFQITMGIVTVYALFGDDVRTLVTNTYGDPVFWVLNCVCLGAFGVEIIITCICKKGYFNSFFFYLDVISTISLILDIGWISNQIFSQGTAKASNAASLAKAGRASRVGTKAGRVVRIVRLIRLVKLYKLAQQRLQAEADKLQQAENEQNANPEEKAELGNKTFFQKKVNEVIVKEKVQKAMHRGGTNGSKKGAFEQINEDQENENSQPDESGAHVIGSNHKDNHNDQDKQHLQSPKQEDHKIFKASKLPPISMTPRKSDGNGLILTDGNDFPEKKDMKKVANEVLQINTKERTRRSTKSATIIRLQKEAALKKNKANENSTQNLDMVESKVGQKLSDLTTQRVIVIVLCIMISIPLFDTGTYSESQTSYDKTLSFIYRNSLDNNSYLAQKSMELYLNFHNGERNPILLITLNTITDACCINYPNTIFNDKKDNKDDLRNEDMYYYTSSFDGELYGYSIADLRGDNELNAILSIVRTVFVSIVLTTAAVLFSSDVETLVLTPIESMMKKVRRIAQNPLEAAQIEEQEALAMEQLVQEGNTKELDKLKEQEGYETVVLEKLIMKIGALLALGFGEAGSEIIAANMQNGGDVDPMLPGRKIVAIFGFCDIRNFTDATEVLQTGVMVFVNEIAEITHSTVDSHLGQSNKNIGDAFLLVWKYNPDDYGPNKEGHLELKDTRRIRNFADLSVLAFLKIMGALTISKKLVKYRNHKGLNERLKNYRVKMGFGLHVGWAIEGAIGSNFKIDASYLSPNVNMASRLEAATKQFGTGLLVSGPLYKTLSKKCQSHLRHIDRVTVKGSIQPLDMYTVDVHLDNIVARNAAKDRFDNADQTLSQRKKQRVLDRIKRNKLREAVTSEKEDPADQFEKDKELAAMREFFIKEFYDEWKVGFNYYLEGKWPQAKAIFDKTLVMLKDKGVIDGPSNTLLEVIQEHGGKAPGDWQGYRALTEK